MNRERWLKIELTLLLGFLLLVYFQMFGVLWRLIAAWF